MKHRKFRRPKRSNDRQREPLELSIVGFLGFFLGRSKKNLIINLKTTTKGTTLFYLFGVAIKIPSYREKIEFKVLVFFGFDFCSCCFC